MSISVELNEDHKSFRKGFKTSLEGDLILISGINGSGKSQLADMIQQEYRKNNTGHPIKINSSVKVNDSPIDSKDVLYKSFRDLIVLQDFRQVNSQNKEQNINTAWNLVNRHRFGYSDYEEKMHLNSLRRIYDYLENNTVNPKSVQQSEFISLMKKWDKFEWQPDDMFILKIESIFVDYAFEIQKSAADRDNVSESVLKKIKKDAPWHKFNRILSELGIRYRVRSEYRFDNYRGLEEEIKLHPYNTDSGKVNLEVKAGRNLSDLSDGEKAIISLVFAAFYTFERTPRKLLILDEYDATFNPSLINAFYKVLRTYFLHNDVKVIIITHSTTTLSLAPEDTVFYEMFNITPRVVEVSRDQYAEMRIAHSEFYSKLNSSQQRIKKLTTQNKKLTKEKESLEKWFSDLKPDNIFICEDKKKATTKLWEHLLKVYDIDNVNVLPSDGCNRDIIENHIEVMRFNDKNYKPRVFRQVDRDMLTDEQVLAIENVENKKNKGYDYKRKFLPVNEVENFALLIKKNKDDFDVVKDENIYDTIEDDIMDSLRQYKRYALHANANKKLFSETSKTTKQSMRDFARADVLKYANGKKCWEWFQISMHRVLLSQQTKRITPRSCLITWQPLAIFLTTVRQQTN